MTEYGGILVLAATPIGNAADAPARLATELATADIVAAEDTRRLRRLVADLGVEPAGRVLSYYDGNEARRTTELLDELLAGRRVLVVTDAGMPTVSDPGYRLVAAAAAAGVRVTAVPGPSAVVTALALSGLPVDRFCFEGFLPRRTGERASRLGELATERRTLVFFEAARRTATTLAAMAEVFGPDRRVAVCRELTKTHEEIQRGSLAELVEWAADGLRGEVTLVVGGAPTPAPPADDELVAAVAELEAAGASRRDAIAEVARQTGAPRRRVYDVIHRGSSVG